MNSNDKNEIRYYLLKIFSKNPNLTQRQMAKQMGLSLGKFNYCLKELVKKGLVKVNRFKSSDNKASYMYILTPQGLDEKAKITAAFLKRKMKEFDEIKRQIKEIAQDAEEEGLGTFLVIKIW